MTASNDTITGPATVDLVITRTFDAPVGRVWRAWADPEDVKRWWGPDGFTAPLAEIDFREGGTSLVAMSAPAFGDMYSTWRYLSIEPTRRIAYIHHLADEHGNAVDPAERGMPPDFPQGQRHEIGFTPLGDGRTELTVTEYGWTPGQMMEFSEIGMRQCLDKMAAIFAGERSERDESAAT